MNIETIRNLVIDWNLRFPTDRIWREKHNIAFMSQQHRDSNFLDQLFELEEDKLFRELGKESEYKPNIGEWLNDSEPKTGDQMIAEALAEMENFPQLD